MDVLPRSEGREGSCRGPGLPLIAAHVKFSLGADCVQCASTCTEPRPRAGWGPALLPQTEIFAILFVFSHCFQHTHTRARCSTRTCSLLSTCALALLGRRLEIDGEGGGRRGRRGESPSALDFSGKTARAKGLQGDPGEVPLNAPSSSTGAPSAGGAADRGPGGPSEVLSPRRPRRGSGPAGSLRVWEGKAAPRAPSLLPARHGGSHGPAASRLPAAAGAEGPIPRGSETGQPAQRPAPRGSRARGGPGDATRGGAGGRRRRQQLPGAGGRRGAATVRAAAGSAAEARAPGGGAAAPRGGPGSDPQRRGPGREPTRGSRRAGRARAAPGPFQPRTRARWERPEPTRVRPAARLSFAPTEPPPPRGAQAQLRGGPFPRLPPPGPGDASPSLRARAGTSRMGPCFSAGQSGLLPSRALFPGGHLRRPRRFPLCWC